MLLFKGAVVPDAKKRLRRAYELLLRAARELGCSDAYIHGRLRQVGLGLRDVLEAPSVEVLLDGR